MGSPAKQGDSPVAEIVRKSETVPEYGGTRGILSETARTKGDSVPFVE